MSDEASTPLWAYQTARQYAERYDSSHFTGLTPASAPLLKDIADFWLQQFGLTLVHRDADVKAAQDVECQREVLRLIGDKDV